MWVFLNAMDVKGSDCVPASCGKAFRRDNCGDAAPAEQASAFAAGHFRASTAT
jgi:hypothetical protein